MKPTYLNERFLEVLQEKYPQKKDLCNVLMDLLPCEKEAIYRRLRGEVPFAVNEIGIVAEQLDISLDRLLRNRHRDFIPDSRKYPDSTTTDDNQNYLALIKYVGKLKEISRQPYSEHVHAVSFMPLGLCVSYPHILKFLIYMHFHLYGEIDRLKTFKSLQLSAKVNTAFKEMEISLKNISKTSYIWDPIVIPQLIENICYFIDMKLINDDEVAQLKKEFNQLLDDLESSAISGRFMNTENEFSLFVSNVHISFTHGYLWSEASCIRVESTYVIQTYASFDNHTCMETKDRIYSLSKMSELISVTGEKERIKFFRQQREIVKGLISLSAN